MNTLRIANLDIATVLASADKICYILSPFDSLDEWMVHAAHKFGVSLAVITGMDWDDDLTPWKAKGVPKGCPDFKGNATSFLSTLVSDVVPAVEHQLDIHPDTERTLTGISLSGLFALWQWMLNDTFRNIISISGSFWYDGFVEWVTSQHIPDDKGKGYFLLGKEEALTNVKAFQPVKTDTMEIVDYLHRNGLDVLFELVPGNHYQFAIERLEKAFSKMFLDKGV